MADGSAPVACSGTTELKDSMHRQPVWELSTMRYVVRSRCYAAQMGGQRCV